MARRIKARPWRPGAGCPVQPVGPCRRAEEVGPRRRAEEKIGALAGATAGGQPLVGVLEGPIAWSAPHQTGQVTGADDWLAMNSQGESMRS